MFDFCPKINKKCAVAAKSCYNPKTNKNDLTKTIFCGMASGFDTRVMESKLTFEYTYTIEGVYTSVFTSREEYDNMSTEDKQNFQRTMRYKIIEEIENDSLPIYDIKVSHTGEDISYEDDIVINGIEEEDI